MLITVNRTYDVDWLDNWNETGWHLVKNYNTLEDAVRCAKEESKKHRVRIMIVDTPTDNSLAEICEYYGDWKD